MRAAVGDRLVIRAHHVGEHDRWAIIQAVQGPDGTAPYKVKWDDGTEGLLWPGVDAVVEHLPAKI